MLTVDELKEVLPVHLKSSASQDLANKINGASSDPEVAEQIKNNAVTYASVLKEGRYRLDDYVHAVTYVSYKLMGHSNQESWKLTFPVKNQNLVAKGSSEKVISAYVAGYTKGKMVSSILEQSLVPTWILNQDAYQEAINVQVRLMKTANSEKVQAEAANSILTHLKRPESKKVDIEIGLKDNSGLSQLKEMLVSLAQNQQDLIAMGMNTREIAHQSIPGSAKDVTPVDPDLDDDIPS